MQQILIPAFPAITIGIIVFFAGAFLTRKIAFLRNYSIPDPVSGGLAAALITWLLFSWFRIEVKFDLVVRDTLLVIFFATIGLNARLGRPYSRWAFALSASGNDACLHFVAKWRGIDRRTAL